jgi:hypothetical protein
LASVIEAWNAWAGDSGVQRAAEPSARTSARDKLILSKRSAFPDPQHWRGAAGALAGSPGHNGSRTGWKASLPWLLEKRNAAKLEEWMDSGSNVPASAATAPEPELVRATRRPRMTVVGGNGEG